CRQQSPTSAFSHPGKRCTPRKFASTVPQGGSPPTAGSGCEPADLSSGSRGGGGFPVRLSAGRPAGCGGTICGGACSSVHAAAVSDRSCSKVLKFHHSTARTIR